MNLRTLLPALLLATPLAHAAAPGQRCHLPGSEEELRCINIPVAVDGASRLALHVTVAPALREAARPDPLFVLAGGPGQAGSDVVMLLNSALRKVRGTRDVVFVDQRGTGRSGKLDCALAPDEHDEAVLDNAVRACLAAVKTPLAAYGTAQAANDIEQARRALGYGKINLWGGSYGTRLAQAYARAYPASVRSLVLDGVAAPDQIIPAGARDGQAALDALFDQCARDSACAKAYPALRSEFSALATQLAANSPALTIADPRTAAPLHVSMSSRRFLGTVHSILYTATDARRLPFLIHSAYQGRWEPFIARGNMGGDFGQQGSPALLLYLAVTCAEDVPRLTPALLAEDAKGSFLGAPQAERLAQLCGLLKLPPAPAASTAMIEAPVLMLSGALDPVTPPRRATAAARNMRHAQHLVVGSAGHGISSLGCAPRLLREFLDAPAKAVDGKCLQDYPAPAFMLGSAGPQP